MSMRRMLYQKKIYRNISWILILSIFFAGNFVSASTITIGDRISNATIGVSSNHTITFTQRTTFSSGTITIYLRNVISSVGSVNHTDIDLTYGATNAALSASAGASTWGVSIDATNKTITFAYPSSGGTPISSTSSVEIKIGQHTTFQTTGDAQFVNAATNGNKIGSLVAGSDVGLFTVALLTNAQVDNTGIKSGEGGVVIIPPAPSPTLPPTTETPIPPPLTETPPPIEQPIAAKEEKKEISIPPEPPPVKEQQKREEKGGEPTKPITETPVEQLKPPVQQPEVIPPPALPELPIIEKEIIQPPSSSGGSSGSAASTPQVGLSGEKIQKVGAETGGLISLKRDDGVGLEIYVPRQDFFLGRASLSPQVQQEFLKRQTSETCGFSPPSLEERDEILEPEKILEPINLGITPMTREQVRDWSGISIPTGKSALGGHFYRISATRPLDNVPTSIIRFPNPLQYTFQYSDLEISGLDEQSLQVSSWDPVSGTLQQECSIVIPETNTIIAKIDHLTIFLITGQLLLNDGTTGALMVPRQQDGIVPILEPSVTFVASVQFDPIQTQIKGDELGFFQKETKEKTAFAAERFYTTPNTEFSLCVPLSMFKKKVKRITVTVADKKFPLRFDKAKDCYAASIKMPEKKGKQDVVVTIVYIDDQVQVLKFKAMITGEFQARFLSMVAPAVEQVKEVAIVVNTQVKETVKTTQPVLQTTAVVTVPVITASNPTVLTNTVNIWHYLSHFFSSIFSALGLRRRRKPWGIVYHSFSKLPVDLAIVRLFDAKTKRLIETQVTDKNGRFSFLTSPGEYSVTVTKSPFVYPSALVKTSIDGEYSGVYRNQILKISKPDEVINLSIPIDPPAHEKENGNGKESFIKKVKKIFSRHSKLFIGTSSLVSVALAVYTPTKINAILLVCNGAFTVFQIYLMKRVVKSWGAVFDATNGQPIPFAAVSIIDAIQGKLLRTRLTDYQGRYSFLPPPGDYILTVSKDQYLFPPVAKVKTRKYKHLYTKGKLSVKKKRGFAKANLPMEKKI